MAKAQTFGDKVRKTRGSARQMAKIVAAEKKANGQYSFRARMVPADAVQQALKEARQAC
jgi:hypothetical protein